jgi:hypothetical protein
VHTLWSLDNRALFARLASGFAIDPRALDGATYRGTSLGLPALVDKVAWKTFQKTFHRDPATRELRGWNVRLEQDGVDAPSRPRRGSDGNPITFGHFQVVSAHGRRVPGGVEQGLLLDYGKGASSPLDPLARLRDPIVAIEAGAVDLLLGWSYLEMGPLRIRTPSFFTLEREG